MKNICKIFIWVILTFTLYANLKPYWIFPEDFLTSISLIDWMEEYGGRGRTISNLLGSFSSFIPEEDITLIDYHSKKIKEVARFKRFSERTLPFNIGELQYENYLKLLKIPEVHKRGILGDGITIGILDAGFDFSHPALKHLSNPAYGRIVAVHDFNSGDHLFIKFPWTGYREINYNNLGSAYINSFDLKRIGNEAIIFYSYSHDSILYLQQGGIPRNFWKIFVCKVNEMGEFTLPPKIIKRETFAIKPSFEVYGNKIYLTYKTRKNLFELHFSKIQNLDSFNILKDTVIYTSGKLIKPTILNSFGKLNIFFLDTNGLKVIFSQDTGNTWDQNLILQGNFNNYKIIKSEDGFRGFLIKGNPWEKDTLFIFGIDSLYNTFFLKKIGEGIEGDIILKKDTLNICYFNYKNLVYSKFSDSTLLKSLLLDTAGFIYSPKFYYEGNKLFVIYSKSGNLFKVSLEQPFPESLGYFYTDLVNTDSATVLIRRRGDDVVTFEPDKDYDFFLFNHGTRVLSVIAGVSNEITGVSPASRFILARTERTHSYTGQEFENIIEEDFWVEGLEWVISKGANIVNSSLGYINWWNKKDLDGKTAPSSMAAGKAIKKNVLVVNAIGNLAANEFHPQIGRPDTTLHAPADADSIISVGGIVIDSLISVHEKSCYGPSADGRKKPEVVAPWMAKVAVVDLENGDTIFGYYYSEGTSYSTAIVSGVCALAWSVHPSWSAREVLKYLKETSHLLGDTVDNISGWGYPDAERLVFIEPPEVPITQPGKIEDKLLPPYPNPTKYDYIKIPYLLTEGETLVELKIYDVSGKIIFEKDFGFQSVGKYEYLWDLKDKKGKKVDPGIYIVVLKTSFNTSFQKISIVK